MHYQVAERATICYNVLMNNLPTSITVRREARYSVEQELAEAGDLYENEGTRYEDIINAFIDYAVEDLASSWLRIKMINDDTGEEIPWEDIIKELQ